MIKTAVCKLSSNLNKLEKRAGLFEKLRPVKTLGIRLGYPSIKILQFEKGFLGQKVLKEHSFTNPFKNISAPLADEEAAFIEALSSFISRYDKDWDELILEIPRSMVTLKRVSIPTPEIKMIPDILSFEIEKHIPFSPSQALYDYKISGEAAEKIQTLLLSVIKKDIVLFFVELLERVGLTPTIVDISTSSIVNGLFFYLNGTGKTGTGDNYLVIVEKNENHVEIILLKKGQIILSRSLTIPEDGKPLPNENITEFIIREVEKTTVNYPFLKDGNKPPGLVLSGVDSPDLISRLEQELSFNVLTFAGKSKPQNFIHEKLDVTGLCVRGIPGNPFTFNLLPTSYKTGRLPSGIITLTLLSAVLLMLPVCALSAYYKNVRSLDAVSRLLESKKELSRATEELYLKTDRLKEEEKAFALLKNKNNKKLYSIKELTETLPKDVWVQSITLKEDIMELVGYADRASPMINLLENSPLFSEVKFNGRIVKEKNKEKFRLTARLSYYDVN